LHEYLDLEEGHQRDKRGKRENFTIEEERQLVCNVVSIFKDPIMGNG